MAAICKITTIPNNFQKIFRICMLIIAKTLQGQIFIVPLQLLYYKEEEIE